MHTLRDHRIPHVHLARRTLQEGHAFINFFPELSFSRARTAAVSLFGHLGFRSEFLCFLLGPNK